MAYDLPQDFPLDEPLPEELMRSVNPRLPDLTGEIDGMLLQLSDAPVLPENRQRYAALIEARRQEKKRQQGGAILPRPEAFSYERTGIRGP